MTGITPLVSRLEPSGRWAPIAAEWEFARGEFEAMNLQGPAGHIAHLLKLVNLAVDDAATNWKDNASAAIWNCLQVIITVSQILNALEFVKDREASARAARHLEMILLKLLDLREAVQSTGGG